MSIKDISSKIQTLQVRLDEENQTRDRFLPSNSQQQGSGRRPSNRKQTQKKTREFRPIHTDAFRHQHKTCSCFQLKTQKVVRETNEQISYEFAFCERINVFKVFNGRFRVYIPIKIITIR